MNSGRAVSVQLDVAPQVVVANNAFHRWMIHCMAACDMKELGTMDILVLHNANHRERAKRLADICFTLNIEDSHTVAYALRKLVKLGLLNGERRGKETFYTASEAGKDLCLRYREVREQCLIEALGGAGTSNEEIGELARLLRSLAGVYDQAARAAASL